MRASFDFSRININWFPRHMATGLKDMRTLLRRDVDLLVEVRDARIPYSSRNPLLQEELSAKHRIVVFNKSDLAQPESNRLLERDGLVLCKGHSADIRRLLALIRDTLTTGTEGTAHTASTAHAASTGVYRGQKHQAMVVGMPNVGKSTIINGLRATGIKVGGKAVKTGALPGMTRAVSGIVRISSEPLVYLIDTPGITMPRIDHVEDGMKMALTGGLFDRTVGPVLLADYLLFTLNRHQNTQYTEFFRLAEPIDDISVFLSAAAKRIGALLPQGQLDIERTAAFFLRNFRNGKFGRFTLDVME